MGEAGHGGGVVLNGGGGLRQRCVGLLVQFLGVVRLLVRLILQLCAAGGW